MLIFFAGCTGINYEEISKLAGVKTLANYGSKYCLLPHLPTQTQIIHVI